MGQTAPVRPAVLLVPALAAAALLVPAAPAQAATAPAPTVGYDVSYPQADRALPPSPAFAIVGLNGGVATSTNPALDAQLAWAGTARGSGHPRFEVYVNTANPGPKRASWWPKGDRTRTGTTVHSPYGHCDGAATTACAYVYGASLAGDDLHRSPLVTTASAYRWWLDVETANTWSSSRPRNRAVLEGMAVRLTRLGARVGLYALPHEFRDLIGTVPSDSPLAPLPSWVAGAADQAQATSLCSSVPLTDGRLQLVQFRGADTVGPIDQDVACAVFAASPKPTVAGTKRVGRTVTARSGAWSPAAHLAYRWTRDGKDIAKAVHATYHLTKKDAGHRVRVEVTGTAPGFSRLVRTSASYRVHR